MQKLELAVHGQEQDAYEPKVASSKEKKILNTAVSQLLVGRKEKISTLAAKTSELILMEIVIMLATLKVLATRLWPNSSPTKTYGSNTTPKLGKLLLQMAIETCITSMTQALMQTQPSSIVQQMPEKKLAKKTEIVNGKS